MLIKKLFQLIHDEIAIGLGYPSNLSRLINNQPNICIQLTNAIAAIGTESIVQWNEWGQSCLYEAPGTLTGWHQGFNNYEYYIDSLKNLSTCSITDNWECDIQDVIGLFASKSNLTKFSCLDEMVEANSPEMISDVTKEKLYENLAHKEIGILHSQGSSDYFARYLWDGRIFLMNSGGSHHFAAARYIAKRINYLVPLKSKLYTYSLNHSSVAKLNAEFDIYAIPNHIEYDIFDALRNFKATFLHLPLPKPYERIHAIFLPKTESRSMRISRKLKNYGVFSVGQHLTELVSYQQHSMRH